MKTCCPCDEFKHPNKPNIPAGLATLPRQLAGFPEYRLALLRDIPTHASLTSWRARRGNDLGIMLLEMWAYVLDILSFYDERIANETYLRTALRQASLYKLVRLIGYHPRPALAATVVLAAIAEGKQPVTLPARTGFRSDAFDGEPPQIFETEIEQTIHPFSNEWTLAEVRDKFLNLNGELLLDLDTARLAEGQLVLLRRNSPASKMHVGRVKKTQTITALDSNSYLKVDIEPTPAIGLKVELRDVDLLTPTLSASLSLFDSNSVTNTTIKLDAVYPQFAVGAPVIIQRGNDFCARLITSVNLVKVVVSPEVNLPPVISATTVPVTSISLNPPLPNGWHSTPSRLIVHFQMVRGGSLTREAKIRLQASDFLPAGIPIADTVEPLLESTPTAGRLLLQDANDNGLLVDGGVTISDLGKGTVKLDADPLIFDPALRTPIRVFGNPIAASRGETVVDEVLGSGDAAQSFQSFALGNNPLTYLNDPFAAEGRRSTLEVRVNGIEWTEVASFFGMGPQDEVYIARQNEQQETTIAFGDGTTGARLPTGIDNVTATYRFGAGGAKPPAGAIGQLAKPTEGLRRVVNPVAAGGGKDGDRLQEIRQNAPNSALILGRAVSIQDFAALAREFGGVVNAHVAWGWDGSQQRAAVKVWFIADGGKIAQDLQSFLIGRAEPNTPLVATEATAQKPSNLVIDLEVDPRSNPQTVKERVYQTLTDAETGILSLANIPIGRPLFRSRIFESILGVAGTQSVRAITVNGSPAPFALVAREGRYYNFLDTLEIKPISASNGGGTR